MWPRVGKHVATCSCEIRGQLSTGRFEAAMHDGPVEISPASLRILAGWADTFARRGSIGHWEGGETDAAGVIHLSWFEYSDEINRFVTEMYQAELVRPVDWMQWSRTPEGQRLIADPAEIAGATQEDLVYLLTTILRGERFSDGEIAAAYERGTLLAIAERAGALLASEQG